MAVPKYEGALEDLLSHELSFQNVSEEVLRGALTYLRNNANRRYNNLKQKGYTEAEAFKYLDKSGGLIKPQSKLTKSQVLSEIVRARYFLNLKTSQAGYYKTLKSERDAWVERAFGNATKAQRDEYYEVRNKLMETGTWQSTKSYGSDERANEIITYLEGLDINDPTLSDKDKHKMRIDMAKEHMQKLLEGKYEQSQYDMIQLEGRRVEPQQFKTRTKNYTKSRSK